MKQVQQLSSSTPPPFPQGDTSHLQHAYIHQINNVMTEVSQYTNYTYILVHNIINYFDQKQRKLLSLKIIPSCTPRRIQFISRVKNSELFSVTV